MNENKFLKWIGSEIKQYEDELQFMYRVEVLEEIKRGMKEGRWD